MILAWYPIKDLRETAGFIRTVSNLEIANAHRLELIRDGSADPALRGSGLIAINPPFTLAPAAQILLPALAKAFWPDDRSTVRIDNLAS